MTEVMRYDLDRDTDEICADMVPADGGRYVESTDFDRVTAERDGLQLLLNQRDEQVESLEQQREAELRNGQDMQQRLTAADERWDELVSAVRSINRSPHYMVKAIDDDQPQYRQRKEWIDWVLELCDAAPTSTERSNKDYAIEHAEYMAKSADDVLAKFQAYGLALLAVDEGGDDGEGELFENIDSARGDLQEALVDLRGMVYEFRKRSAKTR
ncbi:hypothetical protein A7J50_3815 [Pseudomonas antarctica]|uniref:Uncharacterized protein n=1 Tax=Pseudomonas antarctica TaxID=219572 RepID=A0A172Z4F6_9PSED|nr:hypothetical protein [Pseudomonas antarctica]ANF87188.1 hypothetical protein A7J50_3815 [Pseudomonas antarctica]